MSTRRDDIADTPTPRSTGGPAARRPQYRHMTTADRDALDGEFTANGRDRNVAG
jgi:hypothetical protein